MSNPHHIKLVTDYKAAFVESLEALKAIDKKIAYGLAIGLGCYAGAYLLPLVSLSIIGFATAAYYLGLRDSCLAQYQQSLNDLSQVFEWAMGQGQNVYYSLRHPELFDLLQTIGAFVPPERVCVWQDSDFEGSYLSRTAALSKEQQQLLLHLQSNERLSSLDYKLYGMGMSRGVGEVMTNALNGLKDTAVEQIAKKTM